MMQDPGRYNRHLPECGRATRSDIPDSIISYPWANVQRTAGLSSEGCAVAAGYAGTARVKVLEKTEDGAPQGCGQWSCP